MAAAKDTARNFVRQDGVLKEQVRREEQARNRYPERWGFLLDFDEICLKIAREEGMDARHYQRAQQRKNVVPAATTTAADDDDWRLPSSGPMPETTTGDVGRRSAIPDCNLEFYGPLYRSPKETMTPLYTYTNTIFLG